MKVTLTQIYGESFDVDIDSKNVAMSEIQIDPLKKHPLFTQNAHIWSDTSIEGCAIQLHQKTYYVRQSLKEIKEEAKKAKAIGKEEVDITNLASTKERFNTYIQNSYKTNKSRIKDYNKNKKGRAEQLKYELANIKWEDRFNPTTAP